MRSNQAPKLHRTLAFRLTLWYAGIFTLTSCLTFSSFYLLLDSVLKERADNALIKQVNQLLAVSLRQETGSLQQWVTLQAQAAGEQKVFIRLLYPTGVLFSSSNMAYWRTIGVDRAAVQELLSGKKYVFRDVYLTERKDPVRVVYGVTVDGIILQVGQSLTADRRILESFRRYSIIALTLLMLLAAGFGWFMAHRATAGLAAVMGTARRISKDDLDDRVPLRGQGDEIDQLALTFNQMLDRIRSLVTGMREMSDSIAHDLKSPITHIRGMAELALTNAQDIRAYEQLAADTVDACDRLLAMINTMLAISESEAGAGRLRQESVDLGELIREACELFLPLAEEKKIVLDQDVQNDVDLWGDKRQIQRILANLIDNAIKYTAAGGKINISTSFHDEGERFVSVLIKDNGMGISEKDLPHVFDRFYRCDQSRSQSGAGLGLSLARAFAKAHEGDLTVESTLGKGSLFILSLPKSSKITNR